MYCPLQLSPRLLKSLKFGLCIVYRVFLSLEGILSYLIYICTVFNGGRILGRNWDKSLQSFPPCYSQSPLLIPLDSLRSAYTFVIYRRFSSKFHRSLSAVTLGPLLCDFTVTLRQQHSHPPSGFYYPIHTHCQIMIVQGSFSEERCCSLTPVIEVCILVVFRGSQHIGVLPRKAKIGEGIRMYTQLINCEECD